MILTPFTPIRTLPPDLLTLICRRPSAFLTWVAHGILPPFPGDGGVLFVIRRVRAGRQERLISLIILRA